MNKPVKVPFRYFWSTVLVAGVNALPTSPTQSGYSSRLAGVADNFNLYRINRFRFRMHPVANTGVSRVTAAYSPGVSTTSPSTLALIGEFLYTATMGPAGGQTVPSNWVNVPRQLLQGQLPWYRTIQGSQDASEEDAGYIYVAGTSTDAFVIEIEGEYEFKDAIDPGLTLETRVQRREIALARRREKLLAILSSGKGGKSQS